MVKHMHLVFHFSALRPYRQNGPYTPPPLPGYVHEEGVPEFVVSHIVDTRNISNRRQHCVASEGMRDHESSHELFFHRDNCPDKLSDCEQNRGKPCPDPVRNDDSLPTCIKSQSQSCQSSVYLLRCRSISRDAGKPIKSCAQSQTFSCMQSRSLSCQSSLNLLRCTLESEYPVH